ncbi:hypothetical protein ACFQVC_09085 [Streptomyces monticola]|uniref:DUF1349 domain-containing protein n=2 Tax=Streptomyces monticola TaxID=2666263 RepID=A0ABW2JEB7_9ACTN
MTGIITYPPPDHDEIVPGLVPWAKAGLVIKDGLRQGSAYAALTMTGGHGVRMQHNYTHDKAGRPGRVSAANPRWLRLVRSGEMVTGYESADGKRWVKVATVRLAGLSGTAQEGLFASSPGDLTLRRVGLGAGIGEVRFTQTTAVFDHVTVAGARPGAWRGDAVGAMGETDWEEKHRAPGLVEAGDRLTVTGSGDIGPVASEGGARTVENTLIGLVPALLVLMVVAIRFATADTRGARVLVSKALVTGTVAVLVGLVGTGTVLVAGTAILRANGTGVAPVAVLTEVRVVVGAAAVLGAGTVLALALGVLLRRVWQAVLIAVLVLPLPYVLAVSPLLPEGAAQWLLRVTPAAGFAVTQSLREYPQVLAHYVPSEGYFPLAPPAGFAVLCGYAAVVSGAALYRLRRQSAAVPERTDVPPPRFDAEPMQGDAEAMQVDGEPAQSDGPPKRSDWR